MVDDSLTRFAHSSESMSDQDSGIARLLTLMECLRDTESGCPWDIEQTFASIIPHTIEEAYEVAEAVESGSRSALCDELGDLLLQVVFHSQMAREEGSFTFADVVSAITNKMIRRHPHVFGTTTIRDAEAQTVAWEALKAQERAQKANDDDGSPSALAGVSTTLPSMTRALKLQNRASRVGFDWTDARDVINKVDEELAEVKEELDRLSAQTPSPADHSAPQADAALREEIGDLLFAVVNLARKSGVDPETALRITNRKFEWRFRTMEQHAQAHQRVFADLDLDAQEALWQEAKEEERRQGISYYPQDES